MEWEEHRKKRPINNNNTTSGDTKTGVWNKRYAYAVWSAQLQVKHSAQTFVPPTDDIRQIMVSVCVCC